MQHSMSMNLLVTLLLFALTVQVLWIWRTSGLCCREVQGAGLTLSKSLPSVFRQASQRPLDLCQSVIGRHILIVHEELNDALITAQCLLSKQEEQWITILLAVQEIPRDASTPSESSIVQVDASTAMKNAGINGMESVDRIQVWYAEIGSEAPKELLEFEDSLQQLFRFSASKQLPFEQDFDTVWIKSPCEYQHDDVEKTAEFAVKLHQFVWAWDLALPSSTDSMHWIIEECSQPQYTSTLLHNSVIFRPAEMIHREKNIFVFQIETAALRRRRDLLGRDHAFLNLDRLASSLGENNNKNTNQQLTFHNSCRKDRCRHAYMTVLHSDGNYVCGAIVTGHSIRRFDKTNDLVALVTEDMPIETRRELELHGWIVVQIQAMAGPPGTPSWFSINFSKLQAWKVADEMGFDKVALIDSDILFEKDTSVLFNSDTSFAAVPQSSTVFNGGLLVFEPSSWLYDYMLEMVSMLGVPYAFAEQSFLNQIYGWRLHLFHETAVKWKKNSPGPHTREHFMIHYFGFKPWHCPSRERDCNTLEHMRIRNNDDLFHHWFAVHDEMSQGCARVPEHPPSLLGRIYQLIF